MNVAAKQDDAGPSDVHEHYDFSDGDDEDQLDHGGDYTTRLEELMSDEEEHTEDANGASHSEDDEDGFFYSGVDAAPTGSYREQLRDVLGPEHDADDAEDPEVASSVIHDVAEKELFEAAMDDEARVSTVRVAYPCCGH